MKTEAIKTNERFDGLTNLDISTHYRDREYHFFKSALLSAFSYWVVSQSPYDTPDISKALKGFDKYIADKFNPNIPVKLSYDELKELINEDVFESITEIEKLNHPKIDNGNRFLFIDRYSTIKPDYDFIDLGALAKNVFYMVLREHITQS